MTTSNSNSNPSNNNYNQAVPIRSLQQQQNNNQQMTSSAFKRSAPSNSSLFSSSAPSVMPGYSSFHGYMASRQPESKQQQQRFVPIAPAPVQPQYVPYPLQPSSPAIGGYPAAANYEDLLILSAAEDADLINSGKFLREDASMANAMDDSPLFYMDSPIVPGAGAAARETSASSSLADFRQAQKYYNSASQSQSASTSQSPATIRTGGGNSRNPSIPTTATVSPAVNVADNDNNINNPAAIFGPSDLDGFASMSLPDQRYIDIFSRNNVNNGNNNGSNGFLRNNNNGSDVVAQYPVDNGNHVFFATPAHAPQLKKDRSISSASTAALTSSAESIPPQVLHSTTSNSDLPFALQNSGQYPTHLQSGIDNSGMTAELERHIHMLEKQRKRRESHNAVERRRRDNINERIQELSILVPDCDFSGATVTTTGGGMKPPTSASAGSSSGGSNKAAVLKKSIEYIRFLANSNRHLTQQVKNMQEEITALRNQLADRR